MVLIFTLWSGDTSWSCEVDDFLALNDCRVALAWSTAVLTRTRGWWTWHKSVHVHLNMAAKILFCFVELLGGFGSITGFFCLLCPNSSVLMFGSGFRWLNTLSRFLRVYIKGISSCPLSQFLRVYILQGVYRRNFFLSSVTVPQGVYWRNFFLSSVTVPQGVYWRNFFLSSVTVPQGVYWRNFFLWSLK